MWRKALVKLGLAYPPERAPRQETASRSRYGVFVSARAEPYAPAINDKRIAQAPGGDPAVTDSTATISERLVALLRPSTISAASLLEV